MKKLICFCIAILMLSISALPVMAESYAVPLPSEVAGSEGVIGTAIRVSITDLVVTAISLVFLVISGLILRFIVPPLRKWIIANCTKEERSKIKDLIYQTVLAAEQILGAGMGKTKLKYVQDKLMEKGISVDIDAIEAAVYEMNHRFIDGVLMTDEAEIQIDTGGENGITE